MVGFLMSGADQLGLAEAPFTMGYLVATTWLGTRVLGQ
jgi:hypothetical protein